MVLSVVYHSVGIAWCLDVCPTDNNIIAVGGEDRVVKIYDRRESKVIKEIGDSKDGNSST